MFNDFSRKTFKFNLSIFQACANPALEHFDKRNVKKDQPIIEGLDGI